MVNKRQYRDTFYINPARARPREAPPGGRFRGAGWLTSPVGLGLSGMAGGTDLFENVERLVRLRVLGRDVFVPADETLLRCFQYLAPEDVSRGRFCWAGTCGNSSIRYRLAGQADRPGRACRLIVVDGLEITEISPELAWALRRVIPSPAPAPSSP